MSPRTTRYAVSRLAVPLAAVAALVALSGCSSDPNSISEQAKKGDQKGYVAGDGTIEQIPPDKRLDPVSLKGTTLDGKSWSSDSVRGKDVVVVNTWGSWCAPCIKEIPDLQKVWDDVQAAKKPVQFMGINFREGPERGASLAKSMNVTYPSLTDESGTLVLAFGRQAPSTTPATLILDTDGKVAARANGPVSATTLQGLIDDVLKSDS